MGMHRDRQGAVRKLFTECTKAVVVMYLADVVWFQDNCSEAKR